MEDFKTLLVNARNKKKMRKCDVASLFGWTSMYYCRYEKGQLLPTKYNIKKFANFIGISETQLLNVINKEK